MKGTLNLKKILPGIMIFVFSFFSSPAYSVQGDISDHFATFQRSNRSGSLWNNFGCHYVLRQKKGRWFTSSPLTPSVEFEVLVDSANGYIKIIDEGTGGGTAIYEYALFRGSDNRMFLSIRKSFVASSVGSHELRAFELCKTGWVDVSSTILPSLDPCRFFESGYSRDESETIKKLVSKAVPSAFRCELPRKGTIIRVEFLFPAFVDLLLDINKNDFTEAEYRKLRYMRTKIISSHFTLRWNKSKNKFELGE